VSVSSTSSSTNTQITVPSLLTTLAQAASNATQLANTRELAQINSQIQNQLNNKIAALQQTIDPEINAVLQSQITALEKQREAITALSPKYGHNANELSDIQTRLANMQTAITNGDSAGFDADLSGAGTDILNLDTIAAPAPFQPDRVGGLKGTGLGIGSSASYDLSTPAGQAAAAQAVKTAQDMIGQIFSFTTTNQLLGTDLSESLSSRINGLTSQQQQSQQSDQAATDAKIQQLTQQAQNEEHLIELSLGSTNTLANALALAENPPQPVNSPFEALQNSAGATAGTYSASQSAPAIMSLLA